MISGSELEDQVWVTSLDTRGLTVTKGKVYSVLRSKGDPVINTLVVLGEALKIAVDKSGCTGGK